MICSRKLLGTLFGTLIVLAAVLACGPDETAKLVNPPPSAVSDLRFEGVTATSLTAIWTAVGADGMTGRSSRYYLGYSTRFDAVWDSLTQVSGMPAPALAGSEMSVPVYGLLPATRYYFWISVCDDVEQCITSGPTSVTTPVPADTTAPADIRDLATGTVTNSSVELTWTAPGDDGSTGTATAYEIRRASASITDTNWLTALLVPNPPAPLPAGQQQRFEVPGLSPGTQYYFAIKTVDDVGNWSGVSNSPGARTWQAPLVATAPVTDIHQTTARSGGTVTSDGGAPVTVRGVCWSTNQNPTIADPKTTDGAGTGSYVSDITGLTAGTRYYVRAYATNSVGTSYGNDVEFPTSPSVQVPTVTTAPVTVIAQTSAKSGGNVTSDGGAAVTARGVCWSTTNPPTIADRKTADSTGTGSFISSITGLTAGTRYYVRAYATNSVGTGYGGVSEFSALSLQLPVVTTTPVTDVTPTTARCCATVLSDGGAPVTAGGVCWSTTNPPTTADSKCDGIGTGSYCCSITGLTAGTRYYVRAYATNSVGTGYGSVVELSTIAQVPTVTTSTVTPIAQTTATSGGNVTSDGGAPVTVRGVCWSTNPNPTTADPKTTNGTGAGSYVSLITGLTAGTQYHVRAYASNSVGTSYGDNVVFQSSPLAVPTVTTSPVTEITQTTAASGGNVTSDGGAPVTVRGVCWSTSPNPTTADPKTTDGAGTGSYVSLITGLTAGTQYHVRAYATNSVGTSYGADVVFPTSPPVLPTVTTSAVIDITQTTAHSGGNVTSDGGAPVTVRGVCWSTNQNPTIADPKTTDGAGTGSYVSDITDLVGGGTRYYVRAYATNTAGTSYGGGVSFSTNTETVTDIDGNVYQTVRIGTQVWMAENLKVTHYRDGTAIDAVTDPDTWRHNTTGACCAYNNSTGSVAIYGRLYNWHAVGGVDRSIAPAGWHVPDSAEWETLVSYLGGTSVAGGKLKEAGTAYCDAGNPGATNESGFSARPGGHRLTGGDYTEEGSTAHFWCADASGGVFRHLPCNTSNAGSHGHEAETIGRSIRCVKD